jgi:galactokinase
VCIAIDLGVAVAVRRSDDGRFGVSSRGRLAQRADPAPCGDIGDRVFAAAPALRRRGCDVPAVEVGVAASLPEGAGLASSAAIILATTAALLRLSGEQMSARALIDTALTAERDIVGIPCGPLDQHAIVLAPEAGALLLDCSTLGSSPLPWPWPDVVLCACDTGERHDVGGEGYRARRVETERALQLLGAATCQEVDEASIAKATLPPLLARRARHISSESRRSTAAAGVIRNRGDPAALGAIMSASHRSLRDDYDVSTAALDAVVSAAAAVPGCFGARLVGAGFGGGAVALVERDAAGACRTDMAAAAGDPVGASWVFSPAPGLAILAPDVVLGG